MTRLPWAGWLRRGVGLVAVGSVATAAVLLPVNQWALMLVDWIRGAGAGGVAVYGVTYVAAAALLLPGSLLTLGAGFAYGPLWGTLLVSPVSMAAAAVSFLLGRSVARGWVSRRMAQDPRFAAIDEAVGREGFKIVLLLRLSPLFPFNLLNYGLGLTQVRLRDYLLGSFLGMLPGTFLFVYLGSLVTSASELASGTRPSGGAGTQALYWGGLAATVAVTVVITRIARKALSRALETQPNGQLEPVLTRPSVSDTPRRP